jgi:hypothetical protein
LQVQVVLTQLAPVAQTLPQEPQLLESLVGSTQTPPQAICGHVQLRFTQPPALQVWLELQAWLQPPQLFTSELVSTQVLLQTVSPETLQAHLLLAQLAPVAQAMPQPPQFFESMLVFVHTPLQDVWPVGQPWHLPLWQVMPLTHGKPQYPQLFGSVLRLTQLPLQLV